MKQNKRIFLLILSLTLVFSILFTAVEIHHDHDCCCDHCEICECIDICINLLSVTAVVFATVFATIAVKFITTTIVDLKEKELPNLTLVDLKVRLDN